MVNITTLIFHGHSSSLFLIFVRFFFLNMNISTLFHLYIMNRVNIMMYNIQFLSNVDANIWLHYKIQINNSEFKYQLSNLKWQPDFFVQSQKTTTGENRMTWVDVISDHFKYVWSSMTGGAQYGHIWSYKLMTPGLYAARKHTLYVSDIFPAYYRSFLEYSE